MKNGDLFLYKGHTVYMYFKDASVAFYYVNSTRKAEDTNTVTDGTVRDRVEEGAEFLCNIGDVLHGVFSHEV